MRIACERFKAVNDSLMTKCMCRRRNCGWRKYYHNSYMGRGRRRIWTSSTPHNTTTLTLRLDNTGVRSLSQSFDDFNETKPGEYFDFGIPIRGPKNWQLKIIRGSFEVTASQSKFVGPANFRIPTHGLAFVLFEFHLQL